MCLVEEVHWSSAKISAWSPLQHPLLLLLLQFQPELTLPSASESCTCCGGAAWSNKSALVFSRDFCLVSTSASASTASVVAPKELASTGETLYNIPIVHKKAEDPGTQD